MGEDPSGHLRCGSEAPPACLTTRRKILSFAYNCCFLSILFILSASVWIGTGVAIGWYIWGR
jgi:hypothetical protein